MLKRQLITFNVINLFVLSSLSTNISVGSIEYRMARNRTSRTFQGLPAFLAGFRLGQGAYTTGLSDLPIPMTKLHNALPYLYPYPLPFWYPPMWTSLSVPTPALHPVNQQQIINLKNPFLPFGAEENYQELEKINEQTINNILQQQNKQNILESSNNTFGTNADTNKTGYTHTRERIITTLSRLLGDSFRNLHDTPIATLKKNSLVTSTINNAELNITEMLANGSSWTTQAETTGDAATQESTNSTSTQPTTSMSPSVAVVESNTTLGQQSNESNETHQGYPIYYRESPWIDYVTFTTSKTQTADQLHNNGVDFRSDPGIESFLTALTPPLESPNEHEFLKPTTNNDFYPMNPSRFSILWSKPIDYNNIT